MFTNNDRLIVNFNIFTLHFGIFFVTYESIFFLFFEMSILIYLDIFTQKYLAA